ncbi:putative methyltransferase PMT5 [Acorus calamus]|uniref:Methyltransferase n=1 Tax=Acorus calamus TaxID=4465 RepID=A0AAV9CVQ8_ACOCL|nr:putative methyltransferase PMT5 [Acorus calamus]
MLGSPSLNTVDPATSNFLVPNIYKSYRKLREQAANEILEIRSLSLGGSHLRELDLCGKERENYVPCYNVTGNLLVGFHDGEEFDRHCEVDGSGPHCLVRPPKDYKIPLRWPAGRDVIWSGNMKITKDQFLSSGSMTKRIMLLEENQIAFHSEDGVNFDSVKDYSRQIAEMIGLGSDSEFLQAGVRTVLDIGCGFGSFGAHLFSLKLMTVCIASYEVFGSQVQLALERGLPAMIGSFFSRQLPYPPLSFDMIHCAQCGIIWDKKGVRVEDFSEDSDVWRSALRNYWSLLTPLIFSDHPKRPGEEDPLPPYNMIRNVMDMNSHYAGLNAAFLEAKKSVWVMNVVPIGTQNTLPLILDRGFAGVLHNWCEPFPTYPRTYDMLHAMGLISHLINSERCDLSNLFLEMDRILRPEGWVVLRDKAAVIEKVRSIVTQIRWDARVIELQSDSDQRLLVCQKPFLKKL